MIVESGKDGRWRFTATARICLWAFVGLVCLGGGGLRIWQNSSYRAALAAWTSKAQIAQIASSSAWQRVQTMFAEQTRSPTYTRSDLELVLNGGNPFQSLPATDIGTEFGTLHGSRPFQPPAATGMRAESHSFFYHAADASQGVPADAKIDHARWDDPVSGASLDLDFVRGRWCGIGLHSGPQTPRPSRTSFDLATDRIRSTIAGSGGGVAPVAWVVLFVVSLLWARPRLVLSEMTLAIALVATTAWLVHPGATFTWRDITSNDMLVVAALMLLLSGAVLATEVQRKVQATDGPPTCDGCGYNLTGNVSGVCPECGRPIPQDLQTKIRPDPTRPSAV